MKTLVIGYGNPLRGDDSFGWKIADQLAVAYEDMPSVEVMSVYQLTPELASPISLAELVIFIDADVSVPAGSVRRFEVPPARTEAASIGTHHIDPGSLMAMTQQLYQVCPPAVGLTVGAGSFHYGDHLTEQVARRQPVVLEIVRNLIEHCQKHPMEMTLRHEHAIVQNVIDQLLTKLQSMKVEPDSEIRLSFRRGSDFPEDLFREAFATFSRGTRLENAILETETVDLNFICPCGYSQTLVGNDLVGHAFVCPECGTVNEIDAANDLEVVGIIIQPRERRLLPSEV